MGKEHEKEVFPGGLVVRDLVLSLLQLRFDPWPGNFQMLQVWLKKEKENTFLLYTFHAAIE